MAVASRLHHEGGLIAHSDGSQHTSHEYTERLKRVGIAPRRGRTGTALDNAMVESIMSTLKRELIKRHTWRTM
jgi:transposase InsO family protein